MNSLKLHWETLPSKVLGLEVWVVGGLVVAGLISSRALPLAPIALVGFWLLRGLAYRRFSAATPAEWAVAGLTLMIPVTLWVTAFPELTHPQVHRLLSGIALYYALVNWIITPERLCWAVWGVAAAGFLLACFATISVEWAPNKVVFVPDLLYSKFQVLVSDPVHPNVIAGGLVILLPVALAVLLFAWRRLHWLEKILIGLAAAWMAAILALSLSRGAWLATGIVLVILAAMRWRWGWLAGFAVAIGGGAVAYFLGVERFVQLLVYSSSTGGIESRIEIWSRALYMIQDFPFTGIGLGSFGPVADMLYPFFLFQPSTVFHAHNLFLQIAVDLGLPGLIAWLAIFLCMLRLSWRLYRLGRSNSDCWIAGLGAGLLCSQVALAVHGMLDAVTWGMVRPAPIVWALWGLIAAAWGVYSTR